MRRTIEQYRNGVPRVICEGSEAQKFYCIDDSRADILELAALLREVADSGLIYWEPNTSYGHAAKALMLKRIDDAIGPKRSECRHGVHIGTICEECHFYGKG